MVIGAILPARIIQVNNVLLPTDHMPDASLDSEDAKVSQKLILSLPNLSDSQSYNRQCLVKSDAIDEIYSLRASLVFHMTFEGDVM